MKTILLSAITLLLGFNSVSQEYTEVTYENCGMLKSGDDEYIDYEMTAEFVLFGKSKTEVSMLFPGKGKEVYSIIGEVNANYIENNMFYEFIVMDSGGRLIKIRYFPDETSGIYFQYEDGTNIQFYNKL